MAHPCERALILSTVEACCSLKGLTADRTLQRLTACTGEPIRVHPVGQEVTKATVLFHAMELLYKAFLH